MLTSFPPPDIIIYVVKEQRGWRNWQTRRTKDPVAALGRVGSSPTLRIVTEPSQGLGFLMPDSNSDNMIFRQV